jgi:hypothetical protein
MILWRLATASVMLVVVIEFAIWKRGELFELLPNFL